VIYFVVKGEYIVDRIEGNIVVLEIDNALININKDSIIGDVKEGDILIDKENIYEIDIEKTKLRKEKINNMMKELWKNE
jgi:Protein of unknown function (DUF3006)